MSTKWKTEGSNIWTKSRSINRLKMICERLTNHFSNNSRSSKKKWVDWIWRIMPCSSNSNCTKLRWADSKRSKMPRRKLQMSKSRKFKSWLKRLNVRLWLVSASMTKCKIYKERSLKRKESKVRRLAQGRIKTVPHSWVNKSKSLKTDLIKPIKGIVLLWPRTRL